jgi:hypothetical protein
MFEVTVHLHIHEAGHEVGSKHLEHQLAKLVALTQAVLEAVVQKPEDLAAITAKIEERTAALKDAVAAASPK